MQRVSRTLSEKVKFDNKNETSSDWLTYPIIDISGAPETTDVVSINRPDIAPPAPVRPRCDRCRQRAIFDATGARMHRVPFSPERLRAALS